MPSRDRDHVLWTCPACSRFHLWCWDAGDAEDGESEEFNCDMCGSWALVALIRTSPGIFQGQIMESAQEGER